MGNWIDRFERFVMQVSASQRRLPPVTARLHLPASSTDTNDYREHPFEERNVHPKLHDISLRLFDNGHYSQSAFEAFKFLDNEVQRVANMYDVTGSKLMDRAFGGEKAVIRLNENVSISDKDEQKGYHFLFKGSVLAIRNPRGHDHSIDDSPESCLDFLGLASMLLRRLHDYEDNASHSAK